MNEEKIPLNKIDSEGDNEYSSPHDTPMGSPHQHYHTHTHDHDHHSFTPLQWILIVFLCFLILLFIYIEILNPKSIDDVAIAFEHSLFSIYKKHPLRALCALYCLICLTIIFCTGLNILSCFLTAFIIHSFWFSFFFILFACLSGDAFTWLVAHHFLADSWKKAMKGNEYVCMLKKQAKFQPLKTAFLVRFLMIPAGLKDYILALLKIPFWCYFGSSILENSIWTLLVCFLSQEFSEIASFLQRKNQWQESTIAEKLWLIISTVLLAFTFGVFAYIGYRIKRHVDKENKIKSRKLSN